VKFGEIRFLPNTNVVVNDLNSAEFVKPNNSVKFAFGLKRIQKSEFVRDYAAVGSFLITSNTLENMSLSPTSLGRTENDNSSMPVYPSLQSSLPTSIISRFSSRNEFFRFPKFELNSEFF